MQPIVKATVSARSVEFFHAGGRFTREIHLDGRRQKLQRGRLRIQPARVHRRHTGEGTHEPGAGGHHVPVDFGTPVLPATVRIRRAA